MNDWAQLDSFRLANTADAMHRRNCTGELEFRRISCEVQAVMKTCSGGTLKTDRRNLRGERDPVAGELRELCMYVRNWASTDGL